MKHRKKLDNKLGCDVCGKPATHSVVIELRTEPNRPPQRKRVLHIVCDEHEKETNIDYWLPGKDFLQLADEMRKESGLFFWKQYSNIHMEKLTKNYH